MRLHIALNPKHESHRITAFHEMLAASGHQVNLVFDHEDLIDKAMGPSLENLGVAKHLLRLVNSVTFLDKKGQPRIMWEVS